jgi:hypothetical protein
MPEPLSMTQVGEDKEHSHYQADNSRIYGHSAYGFKSLNVENIDESREQERACRKANEKDI